MVNSEDRPIAEARARTSRLGPRATIEQFTIDELLGEGGMGEVYRATDNTLRRQVAIKVLHRQGVSAGVRLLREAQAMARLSNPNVVRVHQAGTKGGRVYLVMALVPGGTLRQWLEGERDWRDIVHMFIHAGRGLEAAHRAGLVHRDFKPDNVLIDEDGVPRVTDFGLAAAAGDFIDSSEDGAPGPLDVAITRSGQVMGTPRYMSPEQHLSARADARSDQFSFCVALWEALYKKLPLSGSNLGELATNVTTGRIDDAVDGQVPPPDPPGLAAGVAHRSGAALPLDGGAVRPARRTTRTALDRARSHRSRPLADRADREHDVDGDAGSRARTTAALPAGDAAVERSLGRADQGADPRTLRREPQPRPENAPLR